MSKKLFFSSLFFILLMLFTLSCSDTKPDKFLVNFSDDLNSTTVDVERKLQINVYANFDDASQENVTNSMLWSSSDSSVASVKDGLVTTFKVGEVEITYKTEDETDSNSLFEKHFTFHVKELTLRKIELSSNSLTLYSDEKYQLYAKGVFEDEESAQFFYQDITNDCNWLSLNSEIVGVNNSDAKGMMTALKEGFTSISASSATESASLDVEVKEPAYVRLELNATKNTFNVEQSVILEISAYTSDGKHILLDVNELEWSSSDNEVVSIEKNRATALKRGEATITARLKENTELSSSLILKVDKENYMRLFKNGVEMAFPFVETSEYEELPQELDTFMLRAVGKEFTLSGLVVKNFSGEIINSLEASYDGIFEGDIVSKDSNVSFTLLHNSKLKELHYFYTIDDEFHSSFSQKYKELD